MIYVFDIDGTVCNNTNGNYDNSQPFLERIKAINSLYDNGHEVIFFTARGMKTYNNNINKVNEIYYTFTFNQLKKWGLRFNKLILGKPSADFYIDDKGIKDEDYFKSNFRP